MSSPSPWSRSMSVNCSCALEDRAGFRLREAERTARHAAEGLGFPDRDGQIAAAQIGGHRGAPELGGAERDAGGRQPQVDVDAGKPVERDRLAAPLVVGAQAHGREVGREVERLGGERALQGPPSVAREGENAFADIAVELDVDAGERDGAPTTLVCALRVKRPKPPAGALQLAAQRSVSRSDAVSAASVPSILSVGRWLM